MPINSRCWKFSLLVCYLVGYSQSAHAQTCTGAASLDQAPFQLGAGMAFSSAVRSVGAEFTAGRESFFGFSHAGYDTFKNVGVGAPSVGGGVGGTFPSSGRAHVCSLADLTYEAGPQFGAINTTALLATAGAQVGIVAADTSSVRVVPTLGVAVRLHQTRLSLATTNARISTTTEKFGIANFGVGVILNRQFAITPTITIPFALSGGQTTFGVALTYGF